MRKVPRLYVALKYRLSISPPHTGVMRIVKRETIFSSLQDEAKFGEECAALPHLAPHESCELRIARSPNSVMVRIIKENVFASCLDAANLYWIGDNSFEFKPGFMLVAEEKLHGSDVALLKFSDAGNPGTSVWLRKDIIKAIYDMPNGCWIWTAEQGLFEKDQPDPWLFIYLRENCRIITPTSGDELWIMEKSGGEQLIAFKFPKKAIDMHDRHFVAALRGHRWAGWEWAVDSKNRDARMLFAHLQNLSYTNTPEHPSLVIPEKYISRVYDMAKREFIYQHTPPNPP